VLGAATHFVIVSSAVFILCVKLLGMLLKEEEVKAVASTRTCPECLETIRLGATRCKFCTAQIHGTIES
jgi:large conductance mechanosensitive channel